MQSVFMCEHSVTTSTYLWACEI